jgi:hypothetical protein
MKIYLENIKSISWLNEIIKAAGTDGATFLSCKSPAYFVVHYNYVEDKSEIEINATYKKFEINDLIYREGYQSKSEYTGYLKEPFDTNNLLFYLILRNINKNATEEDKKKIENLFLEYKAQDLKSIKGENKLLYKYRYDIEGKSSFYDAMSSVLLLAPKCVNGIQLVSEMMDNSITKSSGYSFFGSVLSKVVLSLPDIDGGLISEDNGTMRYMLVGEKRYKNAKLQKAKDLLRSGMPLEEIYLQTGWYWNKYDKKWRFRISGNKLLYKYDAIKGIKYKNTLYNLPIPKSFENDADALIARLKDIAEKIENNQNGTNDIIELVKNGYDLKFGDLFEYEEIFTIYPELKDIPVFFIQSDEKGKLPHVCYNADSGFKHIFLSSSYYNKERIISVAAHELQHAIQKIEGFGKGGNEGFASIILSSGGKVFREFFALLTSFIDNIIKKASLIPLTSWKKLANDLKNSGDTGEFEIQVDGKIKKGNVGRKGLDNLIKLIEENSDSENKINMYAQSIAYGMLSIPQFYFNSTVAITVFLRDNMSFSSVELFEYINRFLPEKIKKTDFLISKGWTDTDIRTLFFRAYKQLSGEIESRYVQETLRISDELVEYFTPYTSETIEKQNINVYGIDYPIVAKGAPKFAIELTPENKYILHVQKTMDAPQLILHEFGHILYDIIKVNNFTELEFNYDKNSNLTPEEHFCEGFVDYVARRELDADLSKYITEKRGIKNIDNYDLLIDNFFTGEPVDINEKQLSEMLIFVKQINEMI